jgi:cold shock CspA family protein
MQIPLELTYQDVDRSEWSENFIRRQADRLERYADYIISCRVTLSQPHRHQHSGRPWRVRVEVTIPPGHVLDAVAEPLEVETTVELRTVIRDAFKAMEKQLLRLKNMQHGEVKTHEAQTALVTRLVPDESYGFLKTPEGEEIYFHRSSVLHQEFGRLAIGTEVRFEATMGDQGCRATSVHIVNKPGVRATPGEARRGDVPPDW